AGFAGQPHEDVAAALTSSLETTMDALAEDALARAPARFTCVQTGTAGIGGVYDLWRRGRAWAAGERFRPEHGAPEA
ncbi:MAG TPA: acyltransferase, partial [Thermohalobaculum sp.]|nr:acyltransferase [Thermohalobaculum sp.]